MRKFLIGLALTAAFALPAAAAAHTAPPEQPTIICGTACDGGGGGWTGCAQATGSESGGVWGIAGWRHYLVVDYCKVNGWITKLEIVAHGCDTSGFAFCNVGPAWVFDGGVGTGWAYLQGHAYYGTTVNKLTGLSYTSVVYVYIWLG